MSLSVQVSTPPRRMPWLRRRSEQAVRPAGSDPGGLTGRHVLVTFLAFFAAVFLMNGVMIYWAVATNSGLVANEPYRKGLQYNARIAASERQQQLGWTAKLDVSKAGGIVLVLTDRAGQPVSGLKVETVLGRPATSREDIRIAVAEVAPGRYEARTDPLAAGAWLVTLHARGDSDAILYRIRRRLWLAP